jgi:hypothetical protein
MKISLHMQAGKAASVMLAAFSISNVSGTLGK